MKPGRELDVLIAERVMGIKKVPFDPTKEYAVGLPDEDQIKIGWSITCPKYSTDIAAAFEVVKKFRLKRFDLRMGFTLYSVVWMDFHDGVTMTAEGDTPAHAICLAALKVVDSR